jgi:hypothetical protein
MLAFSWILAVGQVVLPGVAHRATSMQPAAAVVAIVRTMRAAASVVLDQNAMYAGARWRRRAGFRCWVPTSIRRTTGANEHPEL